MKIRFWCALILTGLYGLAIFAIMPHAWDSTYLVSHESTFLLIPAIFVGSISVVTLLCGVVVWIFNPEVEILILTLNNQQPNMGSPSGAEPLDKSKRSE
jgi:hypothetical protein